MLLYHLVYQLETDDWVFAFDNPPPLIWKPGPFDLTLLKDVASIEMNERFAFVEEARQRAEAFLRSWEIDAWLKRGAGQFQFKFKDWWISDRETSLWRPPGQAMVSQMAVEVVESRPPRLTEYPPPPTNFVADRNVEIMWLRLQDLLTHQASVAAAGYFCLTLLEQTAVVKRKQKKLEAAANTYKIDVGVLSELSRLTTVVGDVTTARKYEAGTFRPFTEKEIRWLQEVMKKIIEHAGQVAAGVEPTPVDLSNLPPLT